MFVALAADFGPVATLEPSGSIVCGGGGRGATAWKQDFLLRDFSLFFPGKNKCS